MSTHSCTKYLGGHSILVMGVCMTNDEQLAERLHFIQKSVGAVPGPLDCFLVMRGTKTLGIRMREHATNAMKIAQMLAAHPKVDRVYYPGYHLIRNTSWLKDKCGVWRHDQLCYQRRFGCSDVIS